MDNTISFGTNRQASLEQCSHKRSHCPIEYHVIWGLMFAGSLVTGVVVRLLVRPLANLLRAAVGEPAATVPAGRRRDATLLSEARDCADAAAPFVFQVS